MLTLGTLLEKQDALQAVMKCSIHGIYPEDIEKTEGLVKTAIGQIVIREMRITKRHRDGRKDWQEFIDHIYIWADGQTTKLPYKYKDAITSWLFP